MLRQIYANNFRSLKDFHLTIKPGINVLVGPNGAGKTNIIKWFEFISLLTNNSLRESVGKIGGANLVFRRGQSGKLERELSFNFSGNNAVKQYSAETDSIEEDFYIYYTYEAKINILETQIFYSFQSLKVWIAASAINIRPKSAAHLNIDWRSDNTSNDPSINVSFTSPKSTKINRNGALEDIVTDIDWMRGYYTQRKQTFLDRMIIDEPYFFFPLIGPIKEDLNYGRAYNIIPSVVRSIQDISASAGITYDGSGLAPTIYHIKYAAEFDKNLMNKSSLLIPAGSALLYNKIVDYLRLSNGYINAVDVIIDNFRNEFNLLVSFDYDSSQNIVPLSQLSDGTIKWLALVVAIATENSAFFVEEPENFLHPKLQESAIQILRDHTLSGSKDSFAFVTTHSETLLNTSTPNEIITVEMHDGNTVASRLEDPRLIANVIRKSGFGLGYLYVSGGF